MKKIIHNLRQKPEHIRKHILHASTFILTGIIFLIWIFILHARFSSPEVVQSFQNDLKPLTVIGGEITDTYQNISESIKNK